MGVESLLSSEKFCSVSRILLCIRSSLIISYKLKALIEIGYPKKVELLVAFTDKLYLLLKRGTHYLIWKAVTTEIILFCHKCDQNSWDLVSL